MSKVAEIVAGSIGLIVGLALLAAVLVGGTFYRTECPSQTSWNFNIIPFVAHVASADQSCRVDTATAYYVGKVPFVGGTLRDIINELQGN